MDILWKSLILICILVFLFYVLNYFGLLVTKSCVTLFGTHYSFPTRWEGKFSGTSGYQRRNFVVFRKYTALSIEIETNSGALNFEIKGPDGSTLSPVSGAYGRNASVLIDVSSFKRCGVTLQMDHFDGQFRIVLQ